MGDLRKTSHKAHELSLMRLFTLNFKNKNHKVQYSRTL
nr:MAG TPA: hypothetical protein [Caudoviricetes sp.]